MWVGLRQSFWNNSTPERHRHLGNVKQVTSPQTCPAGSCRSPHLRRGQWTRLIRAPASTWHCLVCDCDSQAVIVLWLLRNHHFVRNLRSEEDSRTALRGADSGVSARAVSSLSFHPEGSGERVFTSSWFKQTGRDVEMVEASLGKLQGPDLGEICLKTTVRPGKVLPLPGSSLPSNEIIKLQLPTPEFPSGPLHSDKLVLYNPAPWRMPNEGTHPGVHQQKP